MQARKAAAKRGPHRRKIALACEPCREKKTRCDGGKPICGPCERRSYALERCVYKAENARSASTDEYIRVLHQRIRDLEDACSRAGVAAPSLQSAKDASISPGQPPMKQLQSEGIDLSAVSAHGESGLSPDQQSYSQAGTVPSSVPGQESQPWRLVSSADRQRSLSHLSLGNAGPAHATSSTHVGRETAYSSTPVDPTSNVTGMGAISVAEEADKAPSADEEYFGSSSTVSFMRLIGQSMGLLSNSALAAGKDLLKNNFAAGPGPAEAIASIIKDLCQGSSRFQVDDFSLPPRPLADHLLDCFWKHIYCLYPFFHRPSFEAAYESLWTAETSTSRPLTKLNIGLGSVHDSGHRSIVFHCALNMIFALGCHFAEFPETEREILAVPFFTRAKSFVRLDFLDVGTIGVAQTLLIITVYLQSTPYPKRCWNAIGAATRVAQCLGLHETDTDASLDPLEREIRRRTWHACVTLDTVVSMTFGRPSMTSHLAPIPLPSNSVLASEPSSSQQAISTTFFIASIELYRILDSILADVYQAWRGRSSQRSEEHTRTGNAGGGLDVIIQIEEKLTAYEANVPAPLNWKLAEMSSAGKSVRLSIQDRLRNILHARFLHLRLLLYRPSFTHLCSEGVSDSRPASRDRDSRRRARGPAGVNSLYSSMSAKCAAACVMAAVELIALVHSSYKTSATDAWWYNGFYSSTAAMVLIMSHTCRPMLDDIDSATVDDTWRKCEQILTDMAAFSLSARNTLRFLQAAYSQVVASMAARDHHNGTTTVNTPAEVPLQEPTTHPGVEGEIDDGRMARDGFATPNATYAPFGNLFLDLDETMGFGAPLDELGFLGKVDFADVPGWMPDAFG